jgi:hypothetical protein
VVIGQPIAFNSTTVARYRSGSGGGFSLLTIILIILVIALGYLYYRELKRSGRTITVFKRVIIHGNGKKKEGG